MQAGRQGPVVSLEAMLAAREARVARQAAARAKFGLPLLSLSMVSPGPVKDGAHARQAFAVALAQLDELFLREGWPVHSRECAFAATGPEALYVVDASPIAIKRAAVALENIHPLGRLWDMDVLQPDGGALSRSQLGEAPRRCLVCGEAAHACARSRAHPLEALLCEIDRMIEEYCDACV